MKRIIIAIILIVLAIMYCKKASNIRIGGPYYYSSFVDYCIPFKPINEITKNEAEKREAYYVAHFDHQGKLILFEKYLKGTVEFASRFIYLSDGSLDRQEISNTKGKRINYFIEDVLVKSSFINLQGEISTEVFNENKISK